MGQFTVRGSSDSAHHPHYEKPRKKKKLEKKNRKNSNAVSVELSYSGEQKFKNYLSLKKKLDHEVYEVLMLEQSFETDPEFIKEQKDFLFAKYFELYGRPMVFREGLNALLESFYLNSSSQVNEYSEDY